MSKKKKSRKQLLDEIAAAYARFGGRENVVTPILYLALDGTLLLINEIGARNLGGVPDDFIGKKISEIVPDMAQTAIERIVRAIESGTGGIFEDLVELPSGKRWFLTNSNVVKNTSGEAIAFEVVSMDVTEWKIAEQKAGLLTKVVEQSSEGIAVANMDGYLLFINEAFAAMHGYRPQELLGKHLSIFHLPEQMPAVIAANKQIRETGQFNGQIWRVRCDGNVFPSLMHNTVLHDESGGEIGIIGTLRDITELKRAEEELKESEQNYYSIFNAANDAIFVHDMETGRILDANEKTFEMFGYTREEICNIDVGAISSGEPPYTQEDASKWIRKAAEEGPQVFEWHCKNKQGHLFWVEVSLKRAILGTTDRVLAVVRDITESKQAAEALRQSESEKALILGSLSELISYQDKSLKIVWANKAAGDSVGKSPEELVGRYCYEIWHGRKEPCQDCPVAKSIESGQLQESEITSPDGRIWYMRGCPVLNEQGDVVGAVETTLEITQRKRAEQALTDSEQKHKNLVENIPGMVYRAHPDWTAEVISGSKEICGYTPEELNSKEEHWLSVIHPDDRERVSEEGAGLIKEQKGIVQVYRIIAKSGENRWVEDHKTSLFSQEGQFVGIDGIAFDITERKRAAHALEYRSNLEKIIMNISRKFINLSSEQINEGINQALKALGEFAEVDRSYIFQFFDEGRKASNTHEWCAEGITPQVDNLQNISVDTLPWWMDKLGRFENINIPDVEKLPARAKNEKQILQAQSIQSLIVIPMVYNRELIGFVGFDSVRRQRTCSEETAAMLTIVSEIFVNVLMRRRIGQELAAHHEKMRRAEQLASLGTLSATIAHELNQPLTVMRLFLQQGLRALKDDNDGDKVAEVIDDCLNELTKAARIVDRFRRFARKSAPVYIAKVNLVEVANGIVEILAGTARREKLNLSFTVESCPPYIIGNNLEIEQMFFVLIQNAIQAADGKTERELAISISSQGDQVHLTFADTCSGIRKEDIDKIFEPFFTTKPANLGTGLGLCILERIVKRHGGSVRVESRFGRGTIFYICLPIKS